MRAIIRNKIVGAIMHNYQVVIIMHFKVQPNMISFTSRLLESHNVNNHELVINNGCQQIDQTNFLDWLKNLRIVLKRERLAYVLFEPLPQSASANASERVQRVY